MIVLNDSLTSVLIMSDLSEQRQGEGGEGGERGRKGRGEREVREGRKRGREREISVALFSHSSTICPSFNYPLLHGKWRVYAEGRDSSRAHSPSPV